MNITVSVIVPCFNQGRYLNELLNNIHAAISSTYEVIIIDDGSNDGVTAKFIDQLTAKSKRQILKVIRQKNKGLSAARNVGLDKSSGKFIQFLDSDDLLFPGKIDTQIAILEQFNCDICIDDYMLCDENKLNLSTPPIDTIGKYKLCFEDIAKYWEREMSIPIHCALLRREVTEEVRFDEDLFGKEDWVFWLHIFSKDPDCIHHKQMGAIYRQHSESMTSESSARMGVMWLLAISKNKNNHPKRFTSEYIDSAIQHFQSYYSPKIWRIHGSKLPEKLYNSAIMNLNKN